jgi:hypothetical protein
MYDSRVNFYLNDPKALRGGIIIQERGQMMERTWEKD